MLFLLIPRDQTLLHLESLYKLMKCSLPMITETGAMKTTLLEDYKKEAEGFENSDKYASAVLRPGLQP